MYAAEAAYRDRPTGYGNKETDAKHVNPLLNEFAKVDAKNAAGNVSGGWAHGFPAGAERQALRRGTVVTRATSFLPYSKRGGRSRAP